MMATGWANRDDSNNTKGSTFGPHDRPAELGGGGPSDPAYPTSTWPFYAGASSTTAAVPHHGEHGSSKPFASSDPGGLHDEFLRFCRESGIEDIAKHSGLVHNGEISDVKAYTSAPALTPTVLMPGAYTGERTAVSMIEAVFPTSPTTDDELRRREPTTPPGLLQPDGDASSNRKKRRVQSRGTKNKGLRHFSLKVCEKVQSKRVTSYNEVADELVAELQKLAAEGHAEGMGNNKNIRRRVYDALNVLMAMGIITKEKKEIRWVGLPTNSKQDLHKLEVQNTPSSELLESDHEARLERIRKKTEHLEELISQQRSYSNLLSRNTKADPAHLDSSSKIHLPFILVNTRNTTEIECEMAEDHSEYFFNFSAPFEIHDDTEVLKRAGMDREAGQMASITAFPVPPPSRPPHLQ